ncbi:MAG: ATP-dependent Clp protease proteolytic subunit [bacterium]
MNIFEKMLRTRKLLLLGEINSSIVETLISLIETMKLDGVTEAKLMINCRGGSVESALHLYAAIVESEIDFTGEVVANCKSSAVTVLQACKTRVALLDSSFLIHNTRRRFDEFLDISSPVEFYIEKLKKSYADGYDMNMRNQKALSARIKMKKLYEDFLVSGDNFSSEIALRMGLIDKIVH